MEYHKTFPLQAAQIYLLAFGLVTILGGVMGYVKAKSTASLIAGGVSGVLLLVAGWLLNTHLVAGAVLALAVSLALLGRFTPALARGKRMPAIYMVPLSALGVIAAVILLMASGG